MSKTLVFSLHSIFWAQAFPEAIVAEALKQKGSSITIVNCGRGLSHFCNCMVANGLNISSAIKAKNKTCKQCVANADLIQKKFKFDNRIHFSSQITPEEILETEVILTKVNRENFLDFKIDEIEIGRIALCEVLLDFKKKDLNFNDEEWLTYRAHLKNALHSYFASKRILETEKPKQVLIYIPFYSVNAICNKLSLKKGIKVYSLYAGTNLAHRIETLMINQGIMFDHAKILMGYWDEIKKIPATRSEILNIQDHMLKLVSGTSVLVYSKAKSKVNFSAREYFKIPKDYKIAIATTSSADEFYSTKMTKTFDAPISKLYPTQIDWVKDLIEYFSKQKDKFLIIRVHPREFPNHREKKLSMLAIDFLKLFEKLPANVVVNWPDQNLSIYDLMEEADVFLNGWSSVGKEMSLFGIPVVLYSSNLTLYPPDLNFFASDNRNEYFEKIEEAFASGWSFERMRLAFRWHALEYSKALFNIGESFKQIRIEPKHKLKKISHKIRNKVQPMYAEKQDCSKRSVSFAEKEILAEMIFEGIPSKMDFYKKKYDFENFRGHSTIDDENNAIKEVLQNLLNKFYGSSRPVSVNNNETLQKKITSFLESNKN